MPSFKQRRKTLRWLLLALIVVLAAGGGAFAYKRRNADADQKKSYTVTRKNISHTLQIAGKVMPDKSMVITAHQSGRIVDIPVKEGSAVNAGDVLFTMRLEAEGQTDLVQKRSEVRTLEQQVAAAAAQLKEKKPVQELIGSAAVLKEENDLEKMKLDLDAARERLAVLENDLGLNAEAHQEEPPAGGKGAGKAVAKRSGKPKAKGRQPSVATRDGIVYVTAPNKGIITLIDKRIGDFVMGGAGTGDASTNDRMVMVEADMATVLVRTRVLEADLRYVKPDIPVRVKLDAYPDAEYDGRVQHIGGQGRTDAKAGYTYFDVDVTVDQQDARLLPEMNATVDLIFAARDNVLTLPVAAVVIFPDRAIVHLPDATAEGGFKEEIVHVGVVNETDVEIVSGLKEGDKVLEIDFAALKLDDGSDKKGKQPGKVGQKRT